MTFPYRVVPDTSVLISWLIFNSSTPSLAMRKAQREAFLLASEETLEELHTVLLRPKFDPAIERSIRENMFAEYRRNVEIISVITPIHLCRDPRDDKFLALALDGRADILLTGDEDLLALHPFRGTAILSPAAFLAAAGQP